MGFADFLHESTPTIDKIYVDELNKFISEVMQECKNESRKGSTRYSSYGDRYGLEVKFPDSLSSKQIKNFEKRMQKDVEERLLAEGFKCPIAEKRGTCRIGNSYVITIDVSCSW